MVPNRIFPRLPICDEGKKKNAKLYFNMEMPSKQQHVQLVNYLRDWKTLFRGQKLIRKLNFDEAKTSWNQTVWIDTQHDVSSNFDKVPISNQRDFIHVLRPTWVYHSDDTNVCFVKNFDDDFIQSLRKLSIIFNHNVFDLCKMSQAKFVARVKHLCEKKKPEMTQYEQTWKARLAVEVKQKIEVEARRKVIGKRKVKANATKDQPGKVILKQSIVVETTQEVDAFIPALIVEAPINKVDSDMTKPQQSETSYEATSEDTIVVTVHTTTSESIPINYAPPEVVTMYEVQEMIGQAMNTFVESQ